MVELDSGFEDALQEAILDEVEAAFLAEDGPVQAAVDRSIDILEEYGREHDYDVGPVIEALQEPAIERTEDSVTAFWGFFHPAAPHFEFGTSDHTVGGDPVLTFVWEDPPEWVREEFDAEGDGWRVFFDEVEVSGLPEARFMRDALNWLRSELRNG